MKVNLNNMSQRAQGFIQNPKFFKEGTSSGFIVSVDDNDSILTVSHGKSPDDIEFILAEVVAKFSENKKISDVWKINFREVESFLRDENHLLAFGDDTHEIESVLGGLKVSLISFAFRSKLKNDYEWFISQRKNWNRLSLTAQNEWAHALIKPLGWELVFCEGDILTVTSTPAGVVAESLSLLINTILGEEETLLPMKVVAV